MFRYMKLQNYKSLIDFQVDFIGKRGAPKKLILIYGENGVGKSNLASAFYTLTELTVTKSFYSSVQSAIEEEETRDLNSLREMIRKYRKDTESIIRSVKTNDSTENMSIEVGFQFNGKKGVYRVETDDSRIVSERLDFVYNKKQIPFFVMTDQKKEISDHIFTRKVYKNEVLELIEQYWGKHTLLSILQAEIQEKNEQYMQTSLCKGLKDVISYFVTMSVCLKEQYNIGRGVFSSRSKILKMLKSGQIDEKDEEGLDRMEVMLNEFFTHLYSDIQRVYYMREWKNGKIKFELRFEKLMYGQIVDVSFAQESTGTQQLLNMLPFLLACVEGLPTVIDEMDTGIHDLLAKLVLDNLSNQIQDQLIVTTHNTALLEGDLAKSSAYIFNVDEEGRKELVPLTDFEGRVHPNLNIRKRYLGGMYGGIPLAMDVDFEELLEELLEEQ